MYLIYVVVDDELTWHSIQQTQEAVGAVFKDFNDRDDIQAAFAVEIAMMR